MQCQRTGTAMPERDQTRKPLSGSNIGGSQGGDLGNIASRGLAGLIKLRPRSPLAHVRPALLRSTVLWIFRFLLVYCFGRLLVLDGR